jgi:DnaJ-class molecular chaperone
MAPVVPAHDYYATLEVSPKATNDEIKASYRRLALLHHPDKNAGSATATSKFQLVRKPLQATRRARIQLATSSMK